MMRYCLTWGFNEDISVQYFKQKGYKLSHTHYYELKNEVESDQSTQDWFNKVALEYMEKDHKHDYLTMKELQKVLMAEVQQLNSTNVYIQKTDKDGNVTLILNPEHDSSLLAKLVAQIDSITKTKAEMLAGTPHVMAIMAKKRTDEARAKELEERSLESHD